MKIIISENRVNQIIRKYLDETFTPDYGWGNNTRHGSYREDVDRYGELVFFINDQDSYIYHGCNANGGPKDEFFAGYGHLHNYECPLLLIYPRDSETLTSLFGNKWLPVFKEWFEENTGLEVTQITNDYI
jgi:hypothetical protein